MEILDEATEDYPEAEENTTNGKPDYSDLFNAPDFSEFVKKPETAVSREYKQKTRAMLKACMMGSLQNGQVPDAAAIIKHGGAFADATGTFAEENEWARKAIDIIASPGNPTMMFIIAAVPLMSQLFRNHEAEIKAVPQAMQSRKERRQAAKAAGVKKPKVEIKLPFIGKKIKLAVGLRFPLGRFAGAFRSQSIEPMAIAQEVFSDPKIIRNLEKQGIRFVQRETV